MSGPVDPTPPIDAINRRRFMQGAALTLAAGSPLLLAACADDTAPSSDIDEANDLKYVQAGRAIELSMIAAYKKIVTYADATAKPLVEALLAAETAQATGLVLAMKLENYSVAAYIAAIPKLTISDLRSTWTSLATASAEHIAVLIGLTSPGDPQKQSPAALVTGTPAPAGVFP